MSLPGCDICFRRQGKLYVADLNDYFTVHNTVVQNVSIYTKVEVERAREAHEFLRASGCPSQEEALHMLSDGNIYMA